MSRILSLIKLAGSYQLSGAVQGVGLRRNFHDILNELGLEGYAANLPSGDVEATILNADNDEDVLNKLREVVGEFEHRKIEDIPLSEITLTRDDLENLLRVNQSSDLDWLAAYIAKRFNVRQKGDVWRGMVSDAGKDQLTGKISIRGGEFPDIRKLAHGPGESIGRGTPKEMLKSSSRYVSVKLFATNGDVTFRCKVVDTPSSMARGLMDVEHLEPDEGMLFIYPWPVTDGFWMKDTYLPLTVIWFDRHGDYVDHADMEPLSTRTYYPSQEYTLALEILTSTADVLVLDQNTKLVIE